TDAWIGEGATINAGGLSLTATANNTNVKASGIGVVAGVAAGGGINATTEISTEVEAYIGAKDGVTPSGTTTTITLTGTGSVGAPSTDKAHSEADGGTAGIVGASGTVANSTVDPTVRATIGDNVNLTSSGNLAVSATAKTIDSNTNAADSYAYGVTVGV